MLSGIARLLETCSEKVSADLHDWNGHGILLLSLVWGHILFVIINVINQWGFLYLYSYWLNLLVMGPSLI